MKKTAIILSVLLILAICIGLTACGGKTDDKANDKTTSSAQETEAATEAEPIEGVKVGDTFTYSGRTITLTEIGEGGEEDFEADAAQGKWVVLKFSVDAGDQNFSIAPDGISINGKAASDAIGRFANGATAIAGSSLKDTENLTFMVLFDVDADTPLDQLGLEVNG